MSMTPAGARKGRGASLNPDNRFFRQHSVREDDGWWQDEARPATATCVSVQTSRRIISRNCSPDIPFSQSINPYQGCEHGCVYCYARPSHAYLDLSPGLDFETRLFAKPEAAALLRQELAHPRYQVSTIHIGANTDAYQPIERDWKITRQLLEVALETRHPVSLISKNALILRDLDLLQALAELELVQVFMSVTSLDGELSRTLEPRASAPHRRLLALEKMSAAGIPCGVMVAPLIPFLNDAEMEAILAAAANAGAVYAGYVFIRLAHELKELFRDWLATHRPVQQERIMAAIQAARGGQDNDARFGARMRGEGVMAELLRQRFQLACRQHGLQRAERGRLRHDLFRAPSVSGQFALF